MKLSIKELFRNGTSYLDQEVVVEGWVRSNRNQKEFGFLSINDGTFFECLQIVYGKEIENFEEISKYRVGCSVTVKGIVQNSEVEQLRKGVKIEDYTTKPAKVKILKTDIEKDISRLEITIHEGKNRQVRKMCEAVGRKVLALHRSKIGNIGVKDLDLGKWRYLTTREVQELVK